MQKISISNNLKKNKFKKYFNYAVPFWNNSHDNHSIEKIDDRQTDKFTTEKTNKLYHTIW